MSKHKKRWVYAMYKGEECLAIGTSEEICEQMGISMKTFYFFRTNWYKGLLKKSKNRRFIIKLEE